MSQSKTSKGKAFDWNLISRVISFAKPYKRIFRLTIVLTIFLALIGPIRPLLIQYTIDNFIMVINLNGLIIMTLIMIIVLSLETVVQYFQTYYSGFLGQSVVKDMRAQLYKHVSKFRLKYFDRTPIGTLVTRVINDIETIADIFSEGLLSIVGDLLRLIIILIVMFYIDWKLTLVVMAPIPFLILATWLFKNGIRKAFNEVRNEVANLNAFTQEHITGIGVIQAFNREQIEMKKFREINHRHRQAHIRSVWYYSVFFPVVEILSAISIALLVWWGTMDMIAASGAGTTPGRVIAFILFVYMLYRPMRQLADRFNTLQMGIVSAERIFKLIDTNEAPEDKGVQEGAGMRGHIQFENVQFAYSGDQYVLNDLNLEIMPGEKLAIVGATGSGKSTMVNLLTRMYDIQEGRICIDGIDIRDYRLEDLNSNIGVVLQDVFLFSDTIMNNIRLNNEIISEQDVIDAAREVGAHSFIERLPGGYNYNVRERGVMLSVGQRQLISFIRAFVYNPKILILDEATSSIDMETEFLIQRATERITRERTSIIIAHRLSTIQHVDKIIVMDKGRIIESGSHQELLAKGGQYKKLFDLQFTKS